jgi:predicted O-linked N-acetylglucosamine transferase (SPINDLY family)
LDAAQLVQRATRHYHAGRLQEAARSCRRALEADPNSADAWHLQGLLAHRTGDHAAAVDMLWRSLTIAPQQASYWNNLAAVHHDTGDLDQAAECLREALRLRPDYAAAYNNLGEILKSGGRLRDALACYRAALQHLPSLPSARSNYLMSLQYDPKVTAGALRGEHLRWGNLPAAVPPPGSFTNVPDPERRLRLGYVSPDFRKHAVARFFAPVLDGHDRDRFAVLLYAEVRGELDSTSKRFRRAADGWRVTNGRDAADLARQVRADGIDILIDLAGHTGRNRLDVFACRPAPVQVTYLGYPHITGLTAIDYRLTDAVLDPPGTPEGPAERLLRLPGTFACFEPPPSAPTVSRSAAARTGRVTFGSHHPLIKLNEAVLSLWRRVLEAVPTSRLLLFRDQFTPRLTGPFLNCLRDLGLPQDRVEIRRPQPEEPSYLAVFHDVDVVLDCFPFTGHTMTCEALWMGVPVLTLRGDHAAGRLSASVLTALGLPELIADSPEAYVRAARELAGHRERLAALRSTLRDRVRQRLCDGPAFVHGLEEAYRGAWRNWCRKSLHSAARSARGSGVNPVPPAGTEGGPATESSAARPAADTSAAQLSERGLWLANHGAFDEAVACLSEAIALDPDSAATHLHLANALRQLDRAQEAVASYREALRLNPKLFAAHAHLAHQLGEEGQVEEAREHYGQAYGLRPQPRLRLVRETLVPVVYDSGDHLRQTRARLLASLRAMEEEGLRVDPTQEMLPAHPYLLYQGYNDRDVMAAIARLAGGPRRLNIRPGPRRGGAKVRIGVLSAHLRNDNVGQRLHHGLVRRLSRDRFEVVVLSCDPETRGLRRQVRQSSDQVLIVPHAVPPALRAIAELGLDVLYLPDAATGALTWTLAFSRLARVQVATWGHPVTTGLPSVDYFLSSRDLDTDAAPEHYTEKLVRLSRLGVVYDRPLRPPPGRDRASFGLPEKAHLYLCPQGLYKFHPDFDAVLGDILRQDPAGLLVLLAGKHPHWTQLLLRRLRRSLPDVYLRVRFLGPLTRTDYLSLLVAADVVLDPVHFGGGNTSYTALALGLPIVTWPSEFLRGRLTYAMYRQMGFTDLVADSAVAYVRCAVRLGTDAEYRAATRRRIEETSGCLYGDTAIVADVEAALLQMMEAARV